MTQSKLQAQTEIEFNENKIDFNVLTNFTYLNFVLNFKLQIRN